MFCVPSQKRRGSKDAQKPERKTQTPTEVSIKHLHQLVWGQMKAVSVHKFELQPVKQFFCKDMEVHYIANYTENESWHANKQKLYYTIKCRAAVTFTVKWQNFTGKIQSFQKKYMQFSHPQVGQTNKPCPPTERCLV